MCGQVAPSQPGQVHKENIVCALYDIEIGEYHQAGRSVDDLIDVRQRLQIWVSLWIGQLTLPLTGFLLWEQDYRVIDGKR